MAPSGARLVDLTMPAPVEQNGVPTCLREERRLMSGSVPYTGVVWHFRHDSMAGTYIDFPGHIKEADDGLDAKGYPINKLFRVEARIVHLNRKSGSGAIGADELKAACPSTDGAGALVVNALGPLRFDEIEERSVYLGADAVRWVIQTGIHLLVSDVYESNSDPQNVFNLLLGNRVSTVCCPDRLSEVVGDSAKLTALPLSFSKANQLPCRLLAEVDERD